MRTLLTFLLLASVASAQEISFTKMPMVEVEYAGGDATSANFLATLRANDLPGTDNSYDVKVTLFFDANDGMMQQYVAVCSSGWITMNEGYSDTLQAEDDIPANLDITGSIKVSYEARTPTTPKGTGILVDSGTWTYTNAAPTNQPNGIGLAEEADSTFVPDTSYAYLNLHFYAWDASTLSGLDVEVQQWNYTTAEWDQVGTLDVMGTGYDHAMYKPIGTYLTKPENWPAEAVLVRCRYKWTGASSPYTNHFGSWVSFQF